MKKMMKEKGEPLQYSASSAVRLSAWEQLELGGGFAKDIKMWLTLLSSHYSALPVLDKHWPLSLLKTPLTSGLAKEV